MKYIRIVDENFNDLLMSIDHKKTYQIEYVRKRGSKSIKDLVIACIVGAIFGIMIFKYIGWNSQIGAGLGVIIAGLLKRFVMISGYDKKLVETE